MSKGSVKLKIRLRERAGHWGWTDRGRRRGRSGGRERVVSDRSRRGEKERQRTCVVGVRVESENGPG